MLKSQCELGPILRVWEVIEWTLYLIEGVLYLALAVPGLENSLSWESDLSLLPIEPVGVWVWDWARKLLSYFPGDLDKADRGLSLTLKLLVRFSLWSKVGAVSFRVSLLSVTLKIYSGSRNLYNLKDSDWIFCLAFWADFSPKFRITWGTGLEFWIYDNNCYVKIYLLELMNIAL